VPALPFAVPGLVATATLPVSKTLVAAAVNAEIGAA
jgi:hypothetical protein